MKLYVLGGGNPDPNPERFGSSFVFEVGGEHLMVDCGPAATYKLAQAGLRPTQINWLFFTHHHFDHNADYPCFLLTRWDQGAHRAARLNVIGPRPDHFGDQVELRREVVDDRPVADPDPLRQPTERQLCDAVVERERDRCIEQLVAVVLVPHPSRS